MSTLSSHEGIARDSLLGPYFFHHVSLGGGGLCTTISYGTSFQSSSKMWICRLESFYGPCMMVLRHIFFLLFGILEQRVTVTTGMTRWTNSMACSYPWFTTLIFLSLGTSPAHRLCYRRQWRPGLSTTDTEWIRDDSHDIWDFPANRPIAVQTRNFLRWSSRWTLRAFSLIYWRSSLGN
jgi:hypothetical protein